MAIVGHEEGESAGFIARVPYHLLAAEGTDNPARRRYPPGRMSLRGSGGRPGGQADRRGCARGLRPRDEKSHLSSSRRLRREELQRKTTRPVGVDHKARVRV